MAEQRGHPVVAVLVALLTGLLTLLLFVWRYLDAEFACEGGFMGVCQEDHCLRVSLLVVGVLVAIVGLWCAWRVGWVNAQLLVPLHAASTARCPFCAEAIQPQAVVCRWCGRDLPGRAPEPPSPPPV